MNTTYSSKFWRLLPARKSKARYAFCMRLFRKRGGKDADASAFKVLQGGEQPPDEGYHVLLLTRNEGPRRAGRSSERLPLVPAGRAFMRAAKRPWRKMQLRPRHSAVAQTTAPHRLDMNAPKFRGGPCLFFFGPLPERADVRQSTAV